VEEIWFQVGNYGFPMVLAIYLLMRVEKKLDALTMAITRLEQVLSTAVYQPDPELTGREFSSKISH
jgi:hypothetical protein